MKTSDTSDPPDLISDSSTSQCHCEIEKECSAKDDCANPAESIVDGLDAIYWDPSSWRLKDKEIKQLIVEKGPIQVRDKKFPKTDGRRFPTFFYTQMLPNRETVARPWLFYSPPKDAAFCFCCALFGRDQHATNWPTAGTSDWKHLSEYSQRHARSDSHIEAFRTWVEFEKRLKTDKTIDAENKRKLDLEAQYWGDVLERIIAILFKRLEVKV